MPAPNVRRAWPAVVAALAVLALLAVAVQYPAQAQESDEREPLLGVSVSAEVVEADAPVSVEATTPALNDDGQWVHGVVVTWEDDAEAMLDDTRFTHHVVAEDGEGDLVIAGRGCGVEWDDDRDEVVFPCTADLRLIQVGPGDTHEYPVRVHPEVGPLQLGSGTYEVEQVIEWWRPGDDTNRNEFTVALTYEVEEVEPADLDFSVQAEIVESGTSFSVDTTSIARNDDGRPAHGVVVTWHGDGTVGLEDARFAHDVEAETGEGVLVTAGRGCGASWYDDMGLVLACTDDLRIIETAPGESHEYPVELYPEVGPLAVAPGTYVVDEVVEWWPVDDDMDRDEVTIRLTYTVDFAGGSAPGTGTLTPEPAPSGVTLATWGGGTVEQLPEAIAYWVTDEGEFVGYIPGAPSFVNTSFMDLFPGGDIPADTTLLVVR